jgi:murein DD-endopeptidase MepM/ murein hydrolase activator NlpD
MVTKPVRYAVLLLAGIVSVGIGWSMYRYFFDTQAPEVVISGIEEGCYYAGDVPCVIAMRDYAKVAEISVFMDDKPLVSHFKINKRHAEYPLVIPTLTLPAGRHELKVEVTDGSYRKNVAIETVTFMVDNVPLQAAFTRSEFDIKVFQGRTLHIMFQVSKSIKSAVIKLLSREYACVPEDPHSLIYESFIPITCEEKPNEYPFVVEIVDHVGNVVTLEGKFQIVLFPFAQQTLRMKQEDIDAEEKLGADQRLLEEKLATLVEQSPPQKLWRGAFYTPTDVKRISTQFGTIRTTQYRGKYTHYGVDIVTEPKHVVWAPQEGIVVIKERFGWSGNTVVIDHGCGIFSLFYHLDSFGKFEVGDKIKQGSPVGTVGKTGFASGYHLHWEMRIQNVPVDPLQWTKYDF